MDSWIDRFIEHTANVETPAIFRKWVAISTLAATLEQKVWIVTSSPMYPNLYTFIIAAPGVGKSRIINEAAKLLLKLPEPYVAPTSINSASLIDHLVECKRTIIIMPDPPIEYNSMALFVGEFGTFMSKYEDDLIAELTDFYDVNALGYGQRRRGNGGLKIQINRPQLNMLIGSTPGNLAKFMPENAWDQGFTSRIIFIYSDERMIVDDFADIELDDPDDLIYDLRVINNLTGKFAVTEEYRKAVGNWRELGEPPKPTHPRLTHYNSRRKAHLYKLSMIAAIDRSNTLLLTKEDFNRAMGWLLEAEQDMPDIFKTVSGKSDSIALDEIYHFLLKNGAMSEHKVTRFAKDKLPSYAIISSLEILERSGMIKVKSIDRLGIRTLEAVQR